MKFYFLRIRLAAGLLAILATPGVNLTAQQPTATPTDLTDATIPSSALLQPTDLVQMLRTSDKPLVLQVGSHVLYAEAHVPGSEYGAAGTSAGLQALREIQELFSGFAKGTSAPERWKRLSTRKLQEFAAQMSQIQFMQGLLQEMMANCRCDTLETCGKGLFHQIGARND